MVCCFFFAFFFKRKKKEGDRQGRGSEGEVDQELSDIMDGMSVNPRVTAVRRNKGPIGRKPPSKWKAFMGIFKGNNKEASKHDNKDDEGDKYNENNEYNEYEDNEHN